MRTCIRSHAIAVVVLVSSAACAPAATVNDAPRATGIVEVTNDGRQDITVYLARDGMRFRLGRVSRMETARFRLPAADLRPTSMVSLIAEPVGGGRPFATSPILWRGGQDLRGRVGRNAGYADFVLLTR